MPDNISQYVYGSSHTVSHLAGSECTLQSFIYQRIEIRTIFMAFSGLDRLFEWQRFFVVAAFYSDAIPAQLKEIKYQLCDFGKTIWDIHDLENSLLAERSATPNSFPGVTRRKWPISMYPACTARLRCCPSRNRCLLTRSFYQHQAGVGHDGLQELGRRISRSSTE